MGKMPGAGGEGRGRAAGIVESGLKTDQLWIRESVEKGLKEDNRLAKTGIQVVVDRIQQLPIPIWMQGFPGGQLFRRRLKAGMEFFDEIRQGRDFMSELRFPSEEDSAEQVIEESNALAAGVLKILRVERS
jgi:hypothetical protein